MFHTVIGIDIWPERVVIAEARVAFTSSKLIRSEEKPYTDAASLKEALQEALGRQPGNAEVRCSFSPKGVSFRYLRFPFHDRRKIEQTLPFQMEPLLPFSAEDCLFAHLVLDRQGENSVVLAAAAPAAIFAEHLAVLDQLQLKPHTLTFRPLPLLSYLAGKDEKSSLLLLTEENNEALVAAWYKHCLFTVRTLHSSSPSKPEDLCRQVDETLQGLESLTDIAYSPSHLTTVNDQELNRKLLQHFPAAEEKTLPETLAGPSTHAVALVLAPADRLPLAMHPTAKSALQKLQQYKTSIILASIGLVLLLALGGADLFMKNRVTDRQYDILQKNIEDIYRTTFPESRKIVDPVLQFQQKIAEIQNTATGRSELHTSNTRILAILSALSEKMPDKSKVTLSRTLIDRQSLQLQGEADSYNSLDSLQKNLKRLAFVSKMRLKEAQLNRKDGRVQFEIDLERTK